MNLLGSILKPDEMKKLISMAVFALMIKTLGFSQSYIITYEKRVRPDVSGQLDEIKEKDPALAEQLKDQLEARVILKIGELVHNDGVSSYQENESKETEDKNLNLKSQQTTKNINVVSVNTTGESLLFKDLKDTSFLKSTEIMGKKFLIKDELRKYDWNLIDEMKIIGNFVCMKATASYDDREITAWYAPSIPVNDGPDEYYGLPGLIMELTGGNTTFNVLSVKEIPELSIEKPSGGKEVNMEEYQKIRNTRMEALRQQYRN